MAETQPTQKRSFLNNIFISPDEPRLRAGWRLVVHTIGYNFLLICITLPLITPILFLGISADNIFLSQVVALLATTPSVFLARDFLDKRPLFSLGLHFDQWALPDFLVGIFISFLMVGLIFLLEFYCGWISFDGFAWESDAIAPVIWKSLLFLGLFILVGWNEELLFRGYRLQTISDGLKPIWGVLISSLWFGVLHLINPNTEARVPVTIGIFLAGVFLSVGYVTTKQLWLPIGLHIGWNFFEGVGFGFPVSGLDIYRLTRITVTGPELWTGGAFGPEAGLVVLPGLLLGTALIYTYTKFARNQQEN